jgi:hypothetical protein
MNKLKLILSITVLMTLTPIFSYAKLHGDQRATHKVGMYERKFKKVSYNTYSASQYSLFPPESGTYDEWSPYLIITFYKDGTPAYIRESDGGGDVPITYSTTEGDEIWYKSEDIATPPYEYDIKTTYYVAFIGGIKSQIIRFVIIKNLSPGIIKTYVNCKEF